MQITYQNYLDKVYGGWLGKCLGGAAGAPVEGFKKLISYEHYSQVIRTDLPNDDLDLQLLWLEVLKKKGPYISSKDLADAWNAQCWYPFSEYGIFLKNYERGIMPPYSGSFNNPVFQEGEGCPIRSEIWGMVFPGEPGLASQYAHMDAVVDHAKASDWIEQYYSAMEAEAFFTEDVQALITDQLPYLPAGTDARNCVELMLSVYREDQHDWKRARKKLMRKFAHFDFTNAITNLGIVILALLYGNGDLDHTINIAFRCGYDTDCTCATAGALLGIVLGAGMIPDELKQMAGSDFVIGIAVDRKNNSIYELAKETCQVGLGIDRLNGRRIIQIPETIEILDYIQKREAITITADYQGKPSIGADDCCKIKITVKNNTDSRAEERLIISGLPEGFLLSDNHVLVMLPAGEERAVEFTFRTGEELKTLAEKNILRVSFGQASAGFGIAGAGIWEAVGPYFEALEKKDPEGMPSPHGAGCDLPTLECMVNNAVYLDKTYLNEENFSAAFAEEDKELINAYEDLMPLDEVFTFKGQGCLYLKQTLKVKENRDVWVVIGNNDGFALWINQEQVMQKDEIRLWTPYNNYKIVHLNKGDNEIVLKLLRRTESLKFSIGFRKFEGEHFHRKRWYTDMEYVVKK